MKKIITLGLVAISLQADCNFTFDRFIDATNRLTVEISLEDNSNPYIVKNTSLSVIRFGKLAQIECKGIAPDNVIVEIGDAVKNANDILDEANRRIGY